MKIVKKTLSENSDSGKPRVKSSGHLSRRSLLLSGMFGLSGLVAGPGLNRALASSRGDAEIIIGTRGEPYSFDGYEYSSVNYIHQRLLYDHLIDYDYELNAIPSAVLAWTMAPDNLSAELTIRDDITLHSGRNWTIADLMQSFERAVDSAEGRQLHGPMAPVGSWTDTGERSVRLDFREQIAEAVLTDILVTMPVTDADRNSVEQTLGAPAGGGPFRLVNRVPNDHFELVRFDDYWQPQLPAIRRIVVQVFDNEDVMISALQSGAIHAANFFPGRAAGRLGSNFAIHEGYEGALGRIFRHQVKTGPFANKLLRQAMLRCIDRERIARDVHHGFAVPAYLPWVGSSIAHDPAFAEKLSFDLREARELIEASGVTSANVMMPGHDAEGIRAAQIVQADLASIDFSLNIELADASIISSRFWAGEFETYLSNIGNIGKRSPSSVTTNSYMRVENNVIWGDDIPADYVEGMETMRTAPDAEVEKRGADQVNRVLADEAWFAPFVLLRSLTAHDARLQGVGRDVDDRVDLLHATYEA